MRGKGHGDEQLVAVGFVHGNSSTTTINGLVEPLKSMAGAFQEQNN